MRTPLLCPASSFWPSKSRATARATTITSIKTLTARWRLPPKPRQPPPLQPCNRPMCCCRTRRPLPLLLPLRTLLLPPPRPRSELRLLRSDVQYAELVNKFVGRSSVLPLHLEMRMPCTCNQQPAHVHATDLGLSAGHGANNKRSIRIGGEEKSKVQEFIFKCSLATFAIEADTRRRY